MQQFPMPDVANVMNAFRVVVTLSPRSLRRVLCSASTITVLLNHLRDNWPTPLTINYGVGQLFLADPLAGWGIDSFFESYREVILDNLPGRLHFILWPSHDQEAPDRWMPTLLTTYEVIDWRF